VKIFTKVPYKSATVAKSLRFFHKFDPVSSSLLYLNKWAHATEFGMMLYDFPMTSCRSKLPSCATTSTGTAVIPRDTTGWTTDFTFQMEMDDATGSIHEFLCDDYDVQPSAVTMSGNKGKLYYSYMNMFNPMPCAEVLVSNVYESLKTNGITVAAGLEPFVPAETFYECTETYLGTLKAYYTTYLASDLEEFRGDKDWETDWLEHSTFVLAWGLMYVHLTYPNYPLCGGKYGVNAFYGGDSTDPANDFVQIIKQHLPGFTPGTGSGGYGPYNWQSGDHPSFKAMYGDMEDFWDSQM